MPGWYASIARKCVAHMPQPVATPAAAIHIALARPAVERARYNNVIDVRVDRKQTIPATTTKRQSCCVVRQVSVRNIARHRVRVPWRAQPRHYLAEINLRFVNQRSNAHAAVDHQQTSGRKA